MHLISDTKPTLYVLNSNRPLAAHQVWKNDIQGEDGQETTLIVTSWPSNMLTFSFSPVTPASIYTHPPWLFLTNLLSMCLTVWRPLSQSVIYSSIKLRNSCEESFMLGKQAGKVVFHRAKGQLLNKCMCLCIIKHFLNPKKEKKKNIQGAIYCRPGDASVRTAQDGDGGASLC